MFLRFSEDAARAEGLTPNQHQLLLAVRAESSSLGVSELAERLQLKANSTLELVRRAEAAGLVSLSPSPEDLRRQLVTLSPDGEARLTRLSEMHREELRRFRAEAAHLLAELR
ncbi:MAG: MarR family transcriptional regulator [Microthrixaceae bacterium]|nr:MarR family transcriptional regulator [Microthrixaceae bacterium]